MPLEILKLLNRTAEQFAIIATELFVMVQDDGRDIPYADISPLIRGKIESVEGWLKGDWPEGVLSQTLATCMKKVKDENMCCALDCQESIQTTGRAFSRCGGCSLISYCGKNCQQRAWRSKEYAHRDICAKVGKVYKLAPEAVPQSDFRVFEEKVRQAGIDDSTLSEVLHCLTTLYSVKQEILKEL